MAQSPLLLSAQTPQEVGNDWQQLLEEVMSVEDEESSGAWEQQLEQLADLYEEKIDLSTAIREDFEQLPFLSAEQVEQLCEYLYHYGPMRSLAELSMIESIDMRTRQLLRQFVKLGDYSKGARKEERGARPEGKLLQQSGERTRPLPITSSLLATARIPFYERKGDQNGYLGYPYRHSLRLVLNRGYHYRVGFVGAQDSGEPFFANKNKLGYDHYSYYFQIRKKGMLKSLVLGHYRLRLGLGLVMNGNMNLGKRAMLANISRPINAITPNASRMSANYLQGVATTIGLDRNFDLTAFVSCRRIDATLRGDTAISTILTTGYHRTPSELERKNNATEWLAGTHLSWRHNGWHAGLTALANGFDKPLQPVTENPSESQRYREIYPKGSTFANVSVDYGYRHSAFTINGETALDKKGGLATLNMLTCRLQRRLQMMAVQRFYSYHYQALHAASFGENSRVQNESGILVGASWQASSRLLLSAYSDYAYFPWPRYQSTDTHLTEQLFEMRWQKPSLKVFARYRLRPHQHRFRLSVDYGQGALTGRTQLDAALDQHQGNSRGWMVGQTVDYRHSHFTLNALLSYFHTDDYNSRLYAYERNLRYTFYFPAYFGQGLHGALYASYAASRRLTLATRLSATHYFDRNTIGSGLQQIGRSTQSDLDMQVYWKL